MYRKIIVPESTNISLLLPDNLVGKQVEIIAFEVDTDVDIKQQKERKNPMSRLLQLIEQNPLVLPEEYKFDRNELYE